MVHINFDAMEMQLPLKREGLDKELLLTKDGSHTVVIPSLDITYRSRHGAIQESTHVFIKAGLHYEWSRMPQETTIEIFELGFGTGLNALLTCVEALAARRKISYTTIEPDPLDPEMARLLNYPDEGHYLQQMHEASWGNAVSIHEYFTFTKYNLTFAEFVGHQASDSDDAFKPGYDLVYFDAFGPLTQPELWSAESFSQIVALMNEGAALTTYCSKTVVRRTMTNAGMQVTKIPGPYGKREMVRAIKVPQATIPG